MRTKLEQITDVTMLLTNITEMESFRRTEMLPHSELVQWMNVLLPTPICTTQLKKQVKKTFDEMQRKQRNKGRDNGQRDSEEFLAAGFLTDNLYPQCAHLSDSVVERCEKPAKSPCI